MIRPSTIFVALALILMLLASTMRPGSPAVVHIASHDLAAAPAATAIGAQQRLGAAAGAGLLRPRGRRRPQPQEAAQEVGEAQQRSGSLNTAAEVKATAGASSGLDGSLEAALRKAVPGSPDFVMATFANSALADHLRNFVAHARHAGIPFVVGAVDEAAFGQLSAEGVASYRTPLVQEAYALDGSNQHASGSWKKFAGMRTGEVRKIVEMGYTVLHTDVDVIWLRNPAPFLMCRGKGVAEFASGTRFACEPMLKADVAVSSDNMSPGRDTHGRAEYSAGGTFNTGLLFIRPTEKGKHFAREWHTNVVSPPAGSRYVPLTSDQQVFNNMMRKPRVWPGISAPHGAAVMSGWDDQVTLGALPMALFMNGHGYFVQQAHKKLGVTPMAVHATYSLDNHDGIAKRQRFREVGLWRAHPDGYFDGRFLALNSSLPPDLQAKIDDYRKRGQKPSNIDVHGHALDAYVKELRDALALAQTLGRTLVLPRWTCYCDRLWSGSDDIFHFGCMYPGSQDGDFVPFTCPMDHVLPPAAWERAQLPYRDVAFLEEGRFGERGKIADLSVVPRGAFDGMPKPQRAHALPTDMSDEEARRLLEPLAAVPVLRLQHARSLLCDVADSARINELARTVLRVPQWCAKCFQPCAQELAKWVPAETLRRSVYGGNTFCLQTPRIPLYESGKCVRNVE